MKLVTSIVRHKGVQVAVIEVPEYDTLAEIQAAGKTEAEIVDFYNKSNKIALQGAERNKHAEGRASKKQLKKIAFNLLTTDEIARFKGDFDALDAFLGSAEMIERVRTASGLSESDEVDADNDDVDANV